MLRERGDVSDDLWNEIIGGLSLPQPSGLAYVVTDSEREQEDTW